MLSRACPTLDAATISEIVARTISGWNLIADPVQGLWRPGPRHVLRLGVKDRLTTSSVPLASLTLICPPARFR